MGMFDTVRCEVSLPGNPQPPPNAWMQTKDFHCLLDTYTIRADGSLIGPKGERIDYHGMLDFGAYENEISYDYRAKFTDGALVEITCTIDRLNEDGGWDRIFPQEPATRVE